MDDFLRNIKNTMSNILEISNLSINFATRDGSFKAVDDISFNIESNKTMALVGESGSGKSVTAMSILQLLPRHRHHIHKPHQ